MNHNKAINLNFNQ